MTASKRSLGDRGRVPFALIGVVLLVGSAAVVAVDRPAPDATPSPAVDRALDDAAKALQEALRTAALSAGRRAARDPVVVPADTPYGRVLADTAGSGGPFERALRARIHAAVRERAARIDVRAGAVRAVVRLPAVDTAADLERAVANTSVARAGPNGTGLQVRLAAVRIVALRDGRVVGQRRLTPTVTVASPVLALHDRMRAFERQLDADLLAPGLGRQLTARLYAIAWARGWAQYGGAPITNVLANRHVEVTTNGAALAVQRATLGAADPDGEAAHRWAALRVAAADLLAGTGLGSDWTDAIKSVTVGPGGAQPPSDWPPTPAHGPNESLTIDVGTAADTALSETTADLGAIAARTYRVDARLVVATATNRSRRGRASMPPGWELVTTRTTETTRVAPADVAVSIPANWTAFARHGRVVITNRTVVRVWRQSGTGARRTTARTTLCRTRVGLAVTGKHSPGTAAPRRGVPSAYDAGGPLDGPNLAGVPAAAIRRLIDDRGGVDTLARRAARDRLDATPITVQGDRPAALADWLRRDLRALDRRVRATNVTVDRGALGSFNVNPPARLAARLRACRSAMVAAPAAYDGIATKARIEARTQYLDRVIAALERRAAGRDRRSAAFERLLDAAGIAPERLRAAMRAADATPPTARAPDVGLGGPLQVRVDTAPPYLTLTAYSRKRMAVRGTGRPTPLDARNWNVFTIPYGDVAERLASRATAPDRTSLTAAANALRAARPAAARNATARRSREALRAAVRDGVAHVVGNVRRSLVRRGVDENRARAILATALERWATPAARAHAVANGSLAAAVTARLDGPPSLNATVRTTVRTALTDPAARPREALVRGATGTARTAARRALRREAGDRIENQTTRRLLRALPNVSGGLPVLPVPGYWYATVNLWHVQSRGTYERVTLRARHGLEDTVYSRDRSVIRADLDGDGALERLGRSTRIGFQVSTVVVVVVPPGGTGVGDSGNALEESPGW